MFSLLTGSEVPGLRELTELIDLIVLCVLLSQDSSLQLFYLTLSQNCDWSKQSTLLCAEQIINGHNVVLGKMELTTSSGGSKLFLKIIFLRIHSYHKKHTVTSQLCRSQKDGIPKGKRFRDQILRKVPSICCQSVCRCRSGLSRIMSATCIWHVWDMDFS